MTPEETLEKIRAQNRARAKRYYENNQAKIATKRKEARDECKECKEEFASRKSFHCHLKAHSLRIGDYYVKHYKRRDLFTKDLLPFKNYEQYFENDFDIMKYSVL